jgi:hypothetical protein
MRHLTLALTLFTLGLPAVAEAFTADGVRPLAYRPETGEPQPKPLRILILGGTGFIGPQQVEYALARKHKLTLFNRGMTNAGLFPDVPESEMPALLRARSFCARAASRLPFAIFSSSPAPRAESTASRIVTTLGDAEARDAETRQAAMNRQLFLRISGRVYLWSFRMSLKNSHRRSFFTRLLH